MEAALPFGAAMVAQVAEAARLTVAAVTLGRVFALQDSEHGDRRAAADV